MGTRCKKYGQIFFPPRADCYTSFFSDMESFTVTGKGRLLSHTKLMYAPVGFEKDLPYTLALADFGDFKVFGRLSKEIPEDTIKVGIEAVPQVGRLLKEKISYKFTKPYAKGPTR